MATSFAERYADLLAAVDRRRGNIPFRIAVASAMGLIGGGMLHWSWILVWLLPYGAVNIIEVAIFRPSRLLAMSMPSRRNEMILALPFLISNTAFAAIAPAFWFLGGPFGPVLATFILAGGVMNVAVLARGSRTAFLVSLAPYLAICFGVILLEPAMEAMMRLMVFIGASLFMLNVFMTWRTSQASLNRERATAVELEDRRREAEEAVTAKSAFVAMISHELRTPISAILAGAAEVERDGDKLAVHGRLIGDAGRMMGVLLNDLLDLAKLDAGRLGVETLPYDLRGLLLDTLLTWRPEAAKKGLRLRVEGMHAVPKLVEGDPTRLKQILNNLLSNAIKFTDHGAVTLRVTAMEGEAHSRLTFDVSDSGPGLNEDQLARLFTPFDQTDISIARKHGGSGLGLAISRELARLMGGDLTALSEAGGGARFRLALSLKTAEANATLSGDADPAPGVADRSARILVVDDHAMNRQAITLILGPVGIVPDLADSAEAALDILARERFDAVLMDVYMPGMDGREATRRLRATPGPNRYVPVIAITASATARDWDDCKAAGMTHHVPKPINAAALYAALDAALDDVSDRDEAAA